MRLHLRDELVVVLTRLEAAAQACAKDDRQRRQTPDRPAFAEVGRVGVDEHRLHRRARAFGNHRKAACQRRQRPLLRARAFGEEHELAAFFERGDGRADHAVRRIVGDVARQPRAGAEEGVAQQVGFHDASAARQLGNEHHRVEHARVVGNDDQARFVAQRPQCFGVQAQHAGGRGQAPEAAIDPGHALSAERAARALGQQPVQRQRQQIPQQGRRAEKHQVQLQRHPGQRRGHEAPQRTRRAAVIGR